MPFLLLPLEGQPPCPTAAGARASLDRAAPGPKTSAPRELRAPRRTWKTRFLVCGARANLFR
eukprot:6170399-Pyramimonas_sp.AAC.1